MKCLLKIVAAVTKQDFAPLFMSALFAAATALTPTIARAQESAAMADQSNLSSVPGPLVVDGLQGGANDPMSPLSFFSNCGPTCSSYGTSGYVVSSVSGNVQAIAVQFTAGANGYLHFVITPNSCGTSSPNPCNQGGHAVVYAQILKNCPGNVPCPTVLRTLRSTQTIPTQPSTAPIIYKYTPQNLHLGSGGKYWLCEEVGPSYPTAQALWMQSISDHSNGTDFIYNTSGGCGGAVTWTYFASGTMRPAFAVN